MIYLNSPIPIFQEHGMDLINARDLFEFLGSKRDFSNWIKYRINQYGFQKNCDYFIFNKIVENSGRPKKEYHLTIGMAKEIGMIENTPRGRQIRQYFKECERLLILSNSRNEFDPSRLSTRDLLSLLAEKIEGVEMKFVEATTPKALPGTQYFTVNEYASMQKLKLTVKEASKIGFDANKICRDLGYHRPKVAHPEHGTVTTFPAEVLETLI